MPDALGVRSGLLEVFVGRTSQTLYGPFPDFMVVVAAIREYITTVGYVDFRKSINKLGSSSTRHLKERGWDN